MAKVGRPSKPDSEKKQPVSIRVEPDTKVFMDLYGDTEYWRQMLKANAQTVAELKQGAIYPDEFSDRLAARVAQITGIPGSEPPPESRARRVDTSDAKPQDHWKSLTQKMFEDQAGDDEA